MAQSSARLADALRIGTRGSPLALAQANEVRARLAAAHGIAPERIALRVITTTGDRIQDRPLSEAGGKGLFTKEIEQALIDHEIDLAVHSAKDVPTVLPPGLVLSATLAREDASDVFISRKAKTLRDLPAGAVIGTASLRRQALVKRLRPDLAVINFRGNVQTRLRKLDEGEVHATLLALAGLKRLGLAAEATAVLDIDEFLPAVGQGVIAIETRADDSSTRSLLAPINHAETETALKAERAFLAVLDGSCRTPIAGHATVDAGRIAFRGLIAKPDGSVCHETARAGLATDAERLGADAGDELRARGGAGFFWCRRDPMRLLVTRPADDGERTAARLRARGHEAVVAALLTIAPIPDADLGDGPWAAAAMTSANAARAFARHPRRSEVIPLPAAVVGEATAEAARAVGFTDIAVAHGDAADLARLLGERFGLGPPLLYLAGADRAFDLAGALAGRIEVRTVEIYRAVALVTLPADIATELAAGRLDGVLHFSRRSADIYVNCARAAGLLDRALAPAQYCLSDQVAKPLRAAGALAIRIAANPDESAILDLVGPA